jgi:hypothetical protein
VLWGARLGSYFCCVRTRKRFVWDFAIQLLLSAITSCTQTGKLSQTEFTAMLATCVAYLLRAHESDGFAEADDLVGLLWWLVLLHCCEWGEHLDRRRLRLVLLQVLCRHQPIGCGTPQRRFHCLWLVCTRLQLCRNLRSHS